MRRKLALSALLLPLLSACAAPGRALGPSLENEGELLLTLRPQPAGGTRLLVTLAQAWAEPVDGAPVPVTLLLSELRPGGPPGERLLARGRLPPGSYRGLRFQVRRATLEREGGAADLSVPSEPTSVELPYAVARKRVTVLSLTLHFERSVAQGQALALALEAAPAPSPVPALQGWVSSAGADALTVFDKHTRRLAAVLLTGRRPEGMVFDAQQLRAYLALSGEDQVAVLDVALGEEIGRIPLRPGDEPRELALTPDGRTLVVTNAGSASVSLLDPRAGLERERFTVGDEPSGLLLDAGGRRAYVLSRRNASMAVVDLGSRALAATVATEAEPARAALDRSGTRLYLAQAGSPSLAVYALPGLTLQRRIPVGLGARALAVDPRTGLVYVGLRGDPALQIYDPISFHPLGTLDLGASPAALAIDPSENLLYALLPSPPELVAVELTSGRVVSRLGLGAEPYQLALPGAGR